MNLDALKNRHRQAILVDDYRQASVIATVISQTECLCREPVLTGDDESVERDELQMLVCDD